MAFVTKLMKTPAVLMLTVALVSSVCVVGCGDNGGGDSTDGASTTESADGAEAGSGGDAAGGDGSGDKE